MLIADNTEMGVYVLSSGSTATLTDTIIRGTEPRPSDLFGGMGVFMTTGGKFEGTRLLIADARTSSLVIGGEGTVISLVDTVIRDTVGQAMDNGYGRGIDLQDGAHLAAERVLIEASHDFGIFGTAAGTAITLTDVAVLDTRPQANDGEHGRGIAVQYETVLEGQRVRVDGAWQIGIQGTAGARVDLADVEVANVGTGPCPIASCPAGSLGYGTAVASANFRLEDFQIHDIATCGIFLALSETVRDSPEADFRSGTVSASAIGACLQVPDYDLDRLTMDVAYTDNGTNLDATMLPVPEAVGGITQ